MGKFEGKVALITGGNSGIGLATAKQFVNEGAYVFITGRCEAELAAAAKEIGRSVTTVRADASKLDDLDRLFSQIKHEKRKLDIVFARDRRIRVNTICPGSTDSPGVSDPLASTEVGQERKKTISSSSPWGDSAGPMKSPRPWCFLRPTTAVR